MRAKKIRTTLLALVFASWANSLCAETGDTISSGDFYNLSLAELGQIEISIATGNSTPLDRAPATATVISAEEILAMGARNLNEVLETVPGLHVSISSLSRLDSVYSIRGIHTGLNPHVLLMLNGIPVQYNAQGGRPTLFRLPAASIERVEVIRGPGSAIYGADAFSGVINVITKDASVIDSTRVGATSGSFGSRELWLETATNWHAVDVAFTMAYQNSDGDKERRVSADLQSTLDSLLGTNASHAPGSLSTRYEVLDTHLALSSAQWQFNFWNWLSRDAGVGAGAAQVLDAAGSDDSDLWMADFTYRFDNDNSDWDKSVRLSYFRYDQESMFTLFPGGAVLPISKLTGNQGNIDFSQPNVSWTLFSDGLIGNPGGTTEDAQLDYVAIFNGWDSHKVRSAVGGREQSATPRERKNFGPGVLTGSEMMVDGTLIDVSGTEYAFLSNYSRSIGYLSLQDEWQITSDLQLTSGVRYDHYSDFGSTTNPRVALVWATNERLTTKLMHGRAFRAPSFTEKASKNNPVSLGNSAVGAERIATTELSFNFYISERLGTNLTLFDYRASDLIEFVPTDLANKIAKNAGDQQGDGYELELNWRPLDTFSLASSYSYQNAQDQSTGFPVHEAPAKQFKLMMNWEFLPEWYLHNQYAWVGERSRRQANPTLQTPGDSRSPIANYSLWDMNVRKANFLPNLDLMIAVRNVADTEAREPSSGEIPEDYLLESRSIWVEFSYRFN
ncbi:TonB-dependent receptor plug domain-containing protein [Cellvibrio sp. OA-2007]|uniref:TonB-dependent receptor plug domain-containing protein n=1 Tax=Cellvibrio sp. OA-2007 TaxID=529823 RepID=UPI0007852E01|nr:TonB-dependent receptor [Cellvibrio sp. OA-2007]